MTDEFDRLAQIVLEEYDQRCSREHITPSPLFRAQVPDFIRDMLPHAFIPLKDRYEEDHIPAAHVVSRRTYEQLMHYYQHTDVRALRKLSDIIIYFLISLTKNLPHGESEFKVDLASFLNEPVQQALSSFSRPNDFRLFEDVKDRYWQYQNYCKENRRTPDLLTAYDKTPIPRLFKGETSFPFIRYLDKHHCMFAKSDAGKTSLLAQSVWELLHDDDPPAMIVFDPHDDFIDKLEHLDYWREHPERLAVLDPSSIPHLNPFDQPDTLGPDATDAEIALDAANNSTISRLYDYMFGETSLSGPQAGAFFPIISLMVAKFRNGGATGQDLLDFSAKPSDPRWRPYIEKVRSANARSFLTNMLDKERVSLEGIHRRVNMLATDPVLFQCFCAPSNRLNLFDILHTEKRTLLVKMDGISDRNLYCRYVLTLLHRFAFERLKRVPDRNKRRPIILLVDEAHEVLNHPIVDAFMTDVRKCGIFVRTFTQFPDKYLTEVRRSITKTSSVLIGSRLDPDDAAELARSMRCDPDMLTIQLPSSSPYLQYAVHVAGEHPTVQVRLRKGTLEEMPKMTPEAYAEVSATARRRFWPPTQSAPSQPKAPHADNDLNPDNL